MAYALQIAAMTVCQEASGEPLEGQKAVAHVLVNRLKQGRYGANLATVCLYPAQFSGWNTKDPNRLRVAAMPDAELAPFEAIVQAALDGTDPDETMGATLYYNPALATPNWNFAELTQTAQIGKHVFFKEG